MTEYHIALTGHRPNKLAGYELNVPFYHRLHDYLLSIIETSLQSYDNVIIHSGMALGADTVWALAAENAMRLYPNRVQLHAEIPVMTQSNIWVNQTDKDRWQHLVALAQSKTVYATKYTPSVMQKRNIGMINHADLLLAVWDGTPGGTGNAVKYAQKNKTQIRYIDPNMFKNQIK